MDHKYPTDTKSDPSTLSSTTTIPIPPPPYLTSTPQPTPSTSSNPKPAYPPQTHHTRSPLLTLPITYDNWKATRILIRSGPDHTSPALYTAKLGLKKPHITFHTASPSAGTGTITPLETTSTTTTTTTTTTITNPPPVTSSSQFASVTFHTLHTHIDAQIRDLPLIKLTTHFSLKSVYTWHSPTLGGSRLSWKSRNTSLELECVDEGSGMTVPELHFHKHLSMSKAGTLDILDGRLCGEGKREECVVTGLAFAEYMVAALGVCID